MQNSYNLIYKQSHRCLHRRDYKSYQFYNDLAINLISFAFHYSNSIKNKLIRNAVV